MASNGREGGSKTGGRLRGTPNKRTQTLIDILDEHGFSPAAKLIETHALALKKFKTKAKFRTNKEIKNELLRLAEGYHTQNVGADKFLAIAEKLMVDNIPRAEYLRIAQSAAKELMEYVYPKRKAVELTGQDGEKLFTSFAEAMKQALDETKNESEDESNGTDSNDASE